MTAGAEGLTARRSARARYSLGEGPTWDATRALVRWVDIDRGDVWESVVGTDGDLVPRLVHRRPETIGAAIHTDGGGILLAAAKTLVWVQTDGTERTVATIVPPGIDSRLNDGACDPSGRYLIGTIDLRERPGGERLVRLEHDGRVTVLDEDLTISNGLGWSNDGGRLFSIDSIPGTVWVRDYDPDGEVIGRRFRAFDVEGIPDGMTVDTDDNLWIAMFEAGEVRCYTPNGNLLETVGVPARHPTAAAFVGNDLSRLLITSACRRVGDESLVQDDGRVFSVTLPVVGRAATPWNPVTT